MKLIWNGEIRHKLKATVIVDGQAELDVGHDLPNAFPHGKLRVIRATVSMVRYLITIIDRLRILARRGDIVTGLNEPGREGAISLGEASKRGLRADQERMREAEPQYFHQHLIVNLRTEPLLLFARQLLKLQIREQRRAPIVDPAQTLPQVGGERRHENGRRLRAHGFLQQIVFHNAALHIGVQYLVLRCTVVEVACLNPHLHITPNSIMAMPMATNVAEGSE